MLIAVFVNRNGASANRAVNMHFDRQPLTGDLVEVEGETMVVDRAWHTPSLNYAGSKFAVALAPRPHDLAVVPAETRRSVHA